ncbi:MAG: lamin tail domain-containing protein [Alphaproteobacteria bacterium]|nr:lamin tail domain-containing protein [Alphaproteobacteria bacterium]
MTPAASPLTRLTRLGLLALLAGGVACNPDPGHPDEGVDYRDGLDGGTTSGERGTVKISEVLWSGSVADDGTWDPTDVFVELRNEGNRPANLSGWRLELDGPFNVTWRFPDTAFEIPVGSEAFVATRSTGCFPNPDWVIPDLRFPQGDGFRLTLYDRDERLMEPVGSADMPPFAGGYDFVTSYSMERINLMFSSAGTEPQNWHFYNLRPCPNSVTDDDVNRNLACYERIPNNDQVSPSCRRHTLASPGRANSPDYSGAYAAGGFD